MNKTEKARELAIDLRRHAARARAVQRSVHTTTTDRSPMVLVLAQSANYLDELADTIDMVRAAMRDGKLHGNPHSQPWGKAVTALTDKEI